MVTEVLSEILPARAGAAAGGAHEISAGAGYQERPVRR